MMHVRRFQKSQLVRSQIEDFSIAKTACTFSKPKPDGIELN